ncbi:GIY-YIG nuclease family protein [Streptomyces sp. NPDC006465]|uniref:GIY-YIG nuclease family protein n=1 Tax=Streptomyces sp. NPDC006465 TaxID=3157174 RepID=UPI0033B1B04F
MLIIHRPPTPERTAASVLAAMQDERLSLRARGLLGLFLSHPDATWPYQAIDRLARDLSMRQRALTGPKAEGRVAMRAVLAELESAGYLVRRRGGSGSRPDFFIEVFHSPIDVEQTPVPEAGGDAEVYMVGTFEGSVVKIGTSTNLSSRLKALQSGFPLRLEILWHRRGGWALEQYLHEQFADLRQEGEWFDFADQDPVDAVVRAVAERYPDESPGGSHLAVHHPSNP